MVRTGTVCIEHIGDMRHHTTVLHSLSHLSEMLVEREYFIHHTAPDGLYGVNCTACVMPLRGDSSYCSSTLPFTAPDGLYGVKCTACVMPLQAIALTAAPYFPSLHLTACMVLSALRALHLFEAIALTATPHFSSQNHSISRPSGCSAIA